MIAKRWQQRSVPVSFNLKISAVTNFIVPTNFQTLLCNLIKFFAISNWLSIYDLPKICAKTFYVIKYAYRHTQYDIVVRNNIFNYSNNVFRRVVGFITDGIDRTTIIIFCTLNHIFIFTKLLNFIVFNAYIFITILWHPGLTWCQTLGNNASNINNIKFTPTQKSIISPIMISTTTPSLSNLQLTSQRTIPFPNSSPTNPQSLPTYISNTTRLKTLAGPLAVDSPNASTINQTTVYPTQSIPSISYYFTDKRTYPLNSLQIIFPLTAFKQRFEDLSADHLHTVAFETIMNVSSNKNNINQTVPISSNSVNDNIESTSSSTYTGVTSPLVYNNDFDIGYEAFTRVILEHASQIFANEKLITNRALKESGKLALVDSCGPDAKFKILNLDLTGNLSVDFTKNSTILPYNLVVSYENFWFCSASRIKYQGASSNQNRRQLLTNIAENVLRDRLNITNSNISISNNIPYYTSLSGDCIYQIQPSISLFSDSKCDKLEKSFNQPPVANTNPLSPDKLSWLQFQNMAGIGEAVLSMLLHFKWSQVSVINDGHSNDARNLAVHVTDYLISRGISVNTRDEYCITAPSQSTSDSEEERPRYKIQSLSEILEHIPNYIRCLIIIGDIFNPGIQEKAIGILSKFVENRKILDNQGTPNKLSLLVLETEYSFKINSFSFDYETLSDSVTGLAQNITDKVPSPNAQPKSYSSFHMPFFNSLFILTYIPFFGVTPEDYFEWFLGKIDKESFYFEQSLKSLPLKITRIPSFLFSTLDYVLYQSMDPNQRAKYINRILNITYPVKRKGPIISFSTRNSSENASCDTSSARSSSFEDSDYHNMLISIYEIKSQLLGFFRISTQGHILTPFNVLHYIDKLSSFKTVLYIEQNIENYTGITISNHTPPASTTKLDGPFSFTVLTNNFTNYIEDLFYYKTFGKLVCEERYVKDLDGPTEELSVAFFSVLLCGILGFSIFFFIKKRMSFKQMFLGPHKIIILPSDLDFNNLSVQNFKSKLMEESKTDHHAESKETVNGSAAHLTAKPNKAGNRLGTSQNFVGSGGGLTSNPVITANSTPHMAENQPPGVNTGSNPTQANASVSSKLNNSMPVLGPHQGYQLARYMGDVVIIRPTPIKGSHVKSKTMRVLRMIRDLRHENINNLIGIFLKPEPPHSLVWEYCNRGSVEDIIKADNIKLDWQFKVSLLTDLAKGMRYIHSSPIRCHGNLKSRNCVIDSRWVLKVTGYGMTYLSEVEDFRIEKSLEDLLWVAPELLRDPILMAKGTQSGDIYSFAIIMQELIVRGPPFHNSNLTTEEILRKVQKPPPLIRPIVSKQDAPPQAIQLMKQCWAEPPNMRPDYNQILEQLKATTQGRKTNIVDTMFKLLEKYSSNLEEIVQERTMQLEEERKKTEALLEKMLPKSVAESLKSGSPVDPESYSEVTIYFSDIVGFTTISAESTPFEVVDFLNDLYTCFDSIIKNYDAYKVETIGDAYMVVSGLPERNGSAHAIQIATLALDLLHNAGKFKIRHKPDIRLKLRIGLHTGPCAAGVVGLTMPRYCLFGDTVNTASRMESNGKPLKIHISWALRDLLESLGGFHIEYRGELLIKGKGMMKTYWLNGKDGFDKSLPKLTDEDDLNKN